MAATVIVLFPCLLVWELFHKPNPAPVGNSPGSHENVVSVEQQKIEQSQTINTLRARQANPQDTPSREEQSKQMDSMRRSTLTSSPELTVTEDRKMNTNQKHK